MSNTIKYPKTDNIHTLIATTHVAAVTVDEMRIKINFTADTEEAVRECEELAQCDGLHPATWPDFKGSGGVERDTADLARHE